MRHTIDTEIYIGTNTESLEVGIRLEYTYLPPSPESRSRDALPASIRVLEAFSYDINRNMYVPVTSVIEAAIIELTENDPVLLQHIIEVEENGNATVIEQNRDSNRRTGHKLNA